MAAERLNMRSVKEILRLHFELGKSARQIAKSEGCGRTAAQSYISKSKASGLLDWAVINKLSESELSERLKDKNINKQNVCLTKKVMPDWQAVHLELRENKDVTLSLLWCEYLELNPDGYKYTQYCEHYSRWSEKLSVIMRQSHKAGEKAFVDYCEGPLLTDPETGIESKTNLFVGCLGASSYTFAEVTKTQTLPDWIGSHVKMFDFFGGVTEITVPDNLKSGVTKPCFYEPVINASYLDWSQHYGTAIIPAHVKKPRHKAKVEANVLVAQRWILACLRKKKFNSIQEMNEAIGPLLEKLNQRQMRHLKKSRIELFEELDRPALKQLPMVRYEFSEWKKVKLNIDYHIEFDGHFYSANYIHVGKELMLRSTSTVIEIFLSGDRIASHRRSFYKGKYTTLSEHMPENHRAMVKWPPSRILSWAQSLGVSVGRLIEEILNSKKHPEQGYRSSMGIIRLEKKYGRQRLDKACHRALELGVHSYSFVSNMLKNNMDKLIANDSIDKKELCTKVKESNTRGREYYH